MGEKAKGEAKLEVGDLGVAGPSRITGLYPHER